MSVAPKDEHSADVCEHKQVMYVSLSLTGVWDDL